MPLADYFTGYRETRPPPGELIRGRPVPLPPPPLTAFHKIAKRPFDDISSVAVAFALDVDGRRRPQGPDRARRRRRDADPRARPPRRRSRAGRGPQETVEAAAPCCAGEGTPIDDQRASAAFRAAMLGQRLRKLFAESRRTESRCDHAGVRA